MRIVLDRPRCEGHGLCEEEAPDLMHLDDEGDLVLDRRGGRGGQHVRRRGRSAVRVCPVAALRLA